MNKVLTLTCSKWRGLRKHIHGGKGAHVGPVRGKVFLDDMELRIVSEMVLKETPALMGKRSQTLSNEGKLS